MRLRCKLSESSAIQHFTRVLTTIGKLTKSCALRLTKDKLYFIVADRNAVGGDGFWCELKQSQLFSEFAMDGHTAEQDEIFLEIIPEFILRCLKSSQAAKFVKIKLTNKQRPCLTFEVALPSLATSERLVIHDVPVNVIPRRLWENYEEPDIPNFDVSVYMPPLKTVKTVAERMRSLSNYMVGGATDFLLSLKSLKEISANHEGKMVFGIKTEMVTIDTKFKDLDFPVWRNTDGTASESQSRDPAEFAKTRIDFRKFCQFLSGQQQSSLRVICNIVHHRLVHLFIIHDDVSFQYYLPAVAS